MPAGDRGILSNPEMTQAFRDNVDIAVGIAESLGTRAFNALTFAATALALVLHRERARAAGAPEADRAS